MKNKYIAIPQMVIGIMLYSIHYLLRILVPAYNYTLIRWYFGDILSLIVIVPIIVNSEIIFRLRRKYYLNVFDIASCFIGLTLYCEIIMPRYKLNMTSDLLDVIAYFISGVLLYLSDYYFMDKRIKIIMNKIVGKR
jgi:integral membrane sensor domain MASE1